MNPRELMPNDRTLLSTSRELSNTASVSSEDAMTVRVVSTRNSRHLARSCIATGTEGEDAREPLLTGQNSVHYDSIYDSQEFSSQRNGIEVIRKRLKSHFMTPYQKFKHRGRKPWKLLLQVLKIIMVTTQGPVIQVVENAIHWLNPYPVFIFGSELFSVVNYMENNHNTFRHLFIENYSSATMSIYTKNQFYSHVRHALHQYYTISDTAVGVYTPSMKDDKISPMQLCTYYYFKGYVDPGNETYRFNRKTNYSCVALLPPSRLDDNITVFKERNNLPVNFERYICISLTAKIKSLHLQEYPRCYTFNVTITFDNSKHDGKIPVQLNMEGKANDCDGDLMKDDPDNTAMGYFFVFIDVLVATVCTMSTALCVRSLYKHLKLIKATRRFFKDQLQDNLSYWDCLDLINMWFILILISDTCTILGSFFKVFIDRELLANYDTCSIFLGSGVLLTWTGVLRYLGYMQKYNILLVTLKASGPSVLRFCVCAALLYFGFMFCGWIVLGPYHPKFRTLSMVSECMFSLINGDDMFMTFKEMASHNTAVWVFSKIYLYTFISLFIYVVLSLFIGIISDTYERIKDWGHPPCTKLERFVHGSNCKRCASEYRSEENDGESMDGGDAPDELTVNN